MLSCVFLAEVDLLISGYGLSDLRLVRHTIDFARDGRVCNPLARDRTHLDGRRCGSVVAR